MRLLERITDQDLMREEMDLFSEILAHGRAGTSVPQRLNERHNETLEEYVGSAPLRTVDGKSIVPFSARSSVCRQASEP
jgi:hypothetical protein